MLEPSSTATRSKECRCEDGRHWHSGEALTLQMLDCSQDRCVKGKFGTHRGRVAHEVHVADLGVTRGLRLYATMVMTTSVCALRQTVFAKLQTAKYVSFARLGSGAAMKESQPEPDSGLSRLNPHSPFACLADTYDKTLFTSTALLRHHIKVTYLMDDFLTTNFVAHALARLTSVLLWNLESALNTRQSSANALAHSQRHSGGTSRGGKRPSSNYEQQDEEEG